MEHDHQVVEQQQQESSFHIQGMRCEHCRQQVEQAVAAVDGVVRVQLDLVTGLLRTVGGKSEAIIAAITQLGYQAQPATPPAPPATAPFVLPTFRPQSEPTAVDASAFALRIDSMHCASCVGRIEQILRPLSGLRQLEARLIDKEVRIDGVEPDLALRALREGGYEAALVASPREAKTPPYTLAIEGMHCAACVQRVETALKALSGLQRVSVDLLNQRALIQGGDPEAAIKTLKAVGYPSRLADERPQSASFYLRPLAGGDLEKLRQGVMAQDTTAQVALEGERLLAHSALHPADLLLGLAAAGQEAKVEEAYADPFAEQATQHAAEIKGAIGRSLVAGIAGLILMAGEMLHFFPPLAGNRALWFIISLLTLGVMAYSGGGYYRGAWRLLRHLSANMDSLVALGAGAAWVASLLIILFPSFSASVGHHLYLETSVMILAFLQVGQILELRAKRSTSNAVSALMGLRAVQALVRRKEGSVQLPVSLLRRGDQVLVRPGEKVPIDGLIIEGESSIDESLLTGEPMPKRRTVGDAVTGGSINRSGAFVLQVHRVGDETTLARMIRMVRQAQNSKAPIGRLADRIAAVFVPVVLIISVLTFCLWWLLGPEPKLAHALSAAIAVLVISCPCALGLATPIAIMVGVSRAAEQGILIRNGEALQSACKLSHIVVDKTGTLTQGRPELSALFPLGPTTKEELVQWAASLEQFSEHPLAEAVLAAHSQQGTPLLPFEQFKARSGAGVSGSYLGRRCFLGSARFIAQQGIILPAQLLHEAENQAEQGGTPVWLADGHSVLGLLVLSDPPRPDSRAAVQALHDLGLEVIMCTGDHHASAASMARRLGVHQVRSEMDPESKLTLIQELQAAGRRVGMVGDGINDAPALAQADLGFALGGGADVAIESADITLAGDSLFLVAEAIAISSATLRTIKQNLFGAFIYNIIGIPLAAGLFYPWTGWLLQPMFASAAMALSSVTVVVNANRLRFFRFKRQRLQASPPESGAYQD